MADPTALEEAYRDQLSKHLPPGVCWPRDPRSNLQKVLLGLAGEFARVHGRALDLYREGDPRLALELLPDWERFLGLPDDCLSVSGDVQTRRAQLVAQLLEGEVPTPAHFVALALALGYDVAVVEHRPFEAGRSVAGDALTNWGDPFLAGFNRAGDRLAPVLGWPFYWDVIANEFSVRHFVAGSTAGSPLASWGNELLECVIRRAAPAHTIPRFLYSTLDVIAWGLDVNGQTSVPAGLDPVEVKAGSRGSIARLRDGTVAVWGSNVFGELTVPDFGSLEAVGVAGGEYTYGAILSDGTVVLWGAAPSGMASVPAPPAGRRFVKLSLGANHALGLLDDGALMAWGSNSQGQITVPALPGSTTWTDISAGTAFSLGVRSDGALLAWGANAVGQCTVPALAGALKYIACSASSPIISAGVFHGLGLVNDGTVRGWGSNGNGQATPPAPGGGLRFVAVAAGGSFSAGLLSDGTIVVWGDGGTLPAPALPVSSTYVSLAAGFYHLLALRRTLA